MIKESTVLSFVSAHPLIFFFVEKYFPYYDIFFKKGNAYTWRVVLEPISQGGMEGVKMQCVSCAFLCEGDVYLQIKPPSSIPTRIW